MIKIFIPSQIANNYTNGIDELNAKGDKLDQVITSLDEQYPVSRALYLRALPVLSKTRLFMIGLMKN